MVAGNGWEPVSVLLCIHALFFFQIQIFFLSQILGMEVDVIHLQPFSGLCGNWSQDYILWFHKDSVENKAVIFVVLSTVIDREGFDMSYPNDASY